MSSKKRDWSINRDAVKALVAVYGPREASRQAKIPYGTVAKWCRVFKWKKVDRLIHTSGINGDPSVPMRDDAATALTKAMQEHKEQSTIHLAQFTAKAAKQAAGLKEPLEKARAVRDVASVYNTLWPVEQGGELIEGGILIGALPVRDDPQEMLEKTANARELQIQEAQRPQGPEV